MNGYGQRGFALRDRDEAMTPREGSGQRGCDDIEVEIQRIDLDESKPGVTSEGFGDLHFGCDAKADDRLFNGQRLDFGCAADRLYLVGRQQLAEDQDLKDVGAVRRTSSGRGLSALAL